MSLGSRREHRLTELILRDDLATTKREQDATALDTLQAFYVQSDIPLQGIPQRTSVLCKGWRVEYDEVVLAVVFIHKLECIIAESLVSVILREIQSDIPVRKVDSLSAAIYGVYP